MASLKNEKKEAIKAAKELLYSKETVEKIEKAKNVFEIDRLLIQARQDKV